MDLPPFLKRAFPIRPENSNKYSIGTVTIVGGCERFPSAPAIAGLGARAGGAGLVQLVVPDAARIPAAALVPEATITKRTPTGVPPKADVTVIGMGLSVCGTSERLVSRLLSTPKGRFVLDADALTIIANWHAQTKVKFPIAKEQTLILTPHTGEAARLLACKSETIEQDRTTAAGQIAERYHAVTILKGAHTIVTAPDHKPWVCNAGNPFMALGGMGDLLAGILAARWARTNDPFLAACAAVWLHATASDLIINADHPLDPSIVNTATQVGSLRVRLERKS